MSTLADRVSEAIKNSGVSAEAIADACDISVQAVYKWKNGLTKTIAGKNLVPLAILTGYEPKWLVSGEGKKSSKTNLFKAEEFAPLYAVRDPILEDLAALDPEDADVWRAQIRAAAIKARKAKMEEVRKSVQEPNALEPPDVQRPAA